MLTLKKLTLEDFGPYRGQQEIEFPSAQGVYIVYGPNGRGKTTLHNAFRYALYGEIRGRIRAKPAIETANTESMKLRGHGYFKTILEFESDKSRFTLTRRFDQSAQPAETMHLERDGVPLTQVQATDALNAIAPVSVSQFFLFDGELLRQYENLLDPEGEEGEALEQAIERVLGIPIVAHALADIKEILRQSQRQVADLYAANDTTKRLGTSLQQAQDLRAEHVAAQLTLEAQVVASTERVAEIELQLKNQERSQRLLGSLDALRSQMTAIDQRERSAIEALGEVVPGVWRALLAPEATLLAPTEQTKLDQAQADVFEASAAARDLAHIGHDSDCPTCRRDMDVALRAEVSNRIRSLASDENRDAAQLRHELLRSRVDVLDKLRQSDASLIAERDRAVRSVRRERRDTESDISEIEDQLSNINEAELRLLTTEREERLTQISKEKGRIADTLRSIADQDLAIIDLLKKLSKEAVKVDPGVELRSEVSATLSKLFAKAIDAYRSNLREEVERNASEVFVKLSAEPDYTGLRITKQYGLEIVDRDGETVHARSAGYEHLVALSLIAALQDSAAVRGPVIMDYPFGRLDSDNTSNVVAALPRMARQVVLLAFDGEFDRETATKALAGELVAEYVLTRVSSRDTRIEKRA